MNRIKLKWILMLLTLATVYSCRTDMSKPGWTYFPDMVYSQAYETYAASPVFEDGLTARPPVPGTIAQGVLPDTPMIDDESYQKSYFYKRYYNDTPEDYESAGRELKNPVPLNDRSLARGKLTYDIYCMVCHGATGDGQGSIVQSGAFPAVNPYTTILANITEGKMFHSITYGRNLMGSYASTVTAEDRWNVIYYIQQLSKTGRFANENQPQAANTN